MIAHVILTITLVPSETIQDGHVFGLGFHASEWRRDLAAAGMELHAAIHLVSYFATCHLPFSTTHYFLSSSSSSVSWKGKQGMKQMERAEEKCGLEWRHSRSPLSCHPHFLFCAIPVFPSECREGVEQWKLRKSSCQQTVTHSHVQAG